MCVHMVAFLCESIRISGTLIQHMSRVVKVGFLEVLQKMLMVIEK